MVGLGCAQYLAKILPGKQTSSERLFSVFWRRLLIIIFEQMTQRKQNVKNHNLLPLLFKRLSLFWPAAAQRLHSFSTSDGRTVRYLSVILNWGAGCVHLQALRLPNPAWHHSLVELYYTNASFPQVWRFIIRSAIRWERRLLAVYRPWVRVLEVGRTKYGHLLCNHMRKEGTASRLKV